MVLYSRPPLPKSQKRCIADNDDKPLDALQLFESHCDLYNEAKLALGHWLMSCFLFLPAFGYERRTSMQADYFPKAICTLEQWGAHHAATPMETESWQRQP
jgi:hypothetical protein